MDGRTGRDVMTMTEKIDEIAKDCSTQGWDSYDGKPISKGTVELAKLIAGILSLRSNEKWDAVPCPGGEIDIINEGERKLISVIEFDR